MAFKVGIPMTIQPSSVETEVDYPQQVVHPVTRLSDLEHPNDTAVFLRPSEVAIATECKEMHGLLRRKLESLEAFIASKRPQTVKDVLKNGPYYSMKNPELYELQLAKVLFAFFSQLYCNEGIKLLWAQPHKQLLRDLRRYANCGIKETAAGLWAGRQGKEHTESYVSPTCYNLLAEVYTEEAFFEEQAEDWANLSKSGIVFNFAIC